MRKPTTLSTERDVSRGERYPPIKQLGPQFPSSLVCMYPRALVLPQHPYR